MNSSTEDRQLLEQYAHGNSHKAFEQLVRRYTDLVYSVALRQLRDGRLAEDVTQGVFMLLAKKAGAIPAGSVLAGWLFWAARLQAQRTLRSARRRQHHERRSVQMSATPSSLPEPSLPEPDAWASIEPLLNQALAHLGPIDRDAILLRFFQQKTHGQIGQALGLSEETAKKRTSRALEKLRNLLRKQGVDMSTAGFSSVLASRALHHAPSTLVAHVAATAVSSATSLSPLAASIRLGAIYMTMHRTALVILGASAFVVAGTLGVYLAAVGLAANAPTPAANASVPSTAPAVAAPIQPAQQQLIYELIYVLRVLRATTPGTQNEQWCDAIRQLTDIGTPAVPYLVAELDRDATGNHYTRALVYTLRAIGDRRAVPALLRAMPRCVIATSDYGLSPLADPQLQQFMVKHCNLYDNYIYRDRADELLNAQQLRDGKQMIVWGRPITEIDAALQKLTRHNEGQDHIRTFPFAKTPADEQRLRDEYRRTADSWQAWWDMNHAQLISDQELATVQLPPVEGDPVEAAGLARFGPVFPADIAVTRPSGILLSRIRAALVAAPASTTQPLPPKPQFGVPPRSP